MIEASVRCTKCSEFKHTGQFYSHPTNSLGMKQPCKMCHAIAHREYKQRPGVKARKNELSRIHYHQPENREKVLARSKRKRYGGHLKSKYGLTESQVRDMRMRQGDCCAICHQKFQKTPQVDHCHKTGVVRGLLCSSCNLGLGKFKDNPARLQSAITYLKDANVEEEQIID